MEEMGKHISGRADEQDQTERGTGSLPSRDPVGTGRPVGVPPVRVSAEAVQGGCREVEA